MNKVILVGRLTKDPELRISKNNIAYCNFTIAIPKKYKKGEADFVECVAWKKIAENLCNYMKKGSLIAVDGAIESNSYNTNEGETKWKTTVNVSIVSFLEKAKSNPYKTADLTTEEKLEYIQEEKKLNENILNNANEVDQEFKKLVKQNSDIDDLPF